MTTNGDVGFTDEALEDALRQEAAEASANLIVRRNDQDALELASRTGVLVVFCPAGAEPYDYLLVDFAAGRSDSRTPIAIAARVARRLDLNILELDTRLEYTPEQWAETRAGGWTPDASRSDEAARIELEGEFRFYQAQRIPYTPDEKARLEAAMHHPEDAELQESATAIRNEKQIEARHAKQERRRPPGGRTAPRWWPFGRNQR